MLNKKAINESKQIGTLYHMCTLDALAKHIVPNDTLSGSGKYTNYLLNSNNVVSFTRDRNYVVNTVRNRTSTFLFRFSVNGDKLSEKYKLSPYNYERATRLYFNKKKPSTFMLGLLVIPT